jgi:hypothetical protein
VKNDTSLYYLLSNNHVNDIIKFPYIFDHDEVSDIFISFIKSLSLRLNIQTVQFFFIEESKSFPLLSRAIEFLKYRDPMVRTGAQSTILNIFRIQDEKARQYSLHDDMLNAFSLEVSGQLEAHQNSIISLCIEYATYSNQPKKRDLTEGKMGQRIENHIQSSLDALEDWMFYLQDIFGLRIPKLTRTLSQHLMVNYLHPILLAPLLKPLSQLSRSPIRRSQSSPDSTPMAERQGAASVSLTPISTDEPPSANLSAPPSPSPTLTPSLLISSGDDSASDSISLTVSLFLLIKVGG